MSCQLRNHQRWTWQRSAWLFGWLTATVTATAVTATTDIAELRDISNQFEPYFHQVLQREQIPGGAFAVVSRERVIKLGTGGYASIDGNDPILADSVFRLASVSKTFAGELTAMLAAENKLRLDDPVARHVPQFRIRGEQQPITLANLLSQSSGIVAHAWDDLIEAGKPVDDILPRFSELRQLCQPGRCYSYQNVAFSLVEQAITAGSNGSYQQQLQVRIFDPLQMRHASVGYAALLDSERLAQPHIKRRQRWVTGEIDQNYYRLSPAAGVNASIIDVALWLQAQLGARPDVIKPELIQMVSQPQIRTPATVRRKHWREHLTDAWYGLGWRVYMFQGTTLIGHGGWVSGYRSEIAWSPQHNIGFAVLLNAEDSSASELITRFWDWYLNPVLVADQSQTATLSLDHGAAQGTAQPAVTETPVISQGSGD